MSKQQLQDAMARASDQRMADHIGISVDTLEDYPYQLDENVSDDGLVYGWRILWENGAPPGITAHGAPGSLWTDIPVLD